MKYQNTRKYNEEDLNILTLEDLLSFSYQVAKGMEFLESKLVSLLLQIDGIVLELANP